MTLDWNGLTAYCTGFLPRWLSHQHPALDWMEAEDVAAEALARLWASRDTFDASRGTGKRWLQLTASRLLIDAHRRQHIHRMIPLDDRLDWPDGHGWQDAAEARIDCERVLAGLTPFQAQALWWYEGLGVSMGTGAAALGIPYRTFIGRVADGRRSAWRLCGQEAA